ncbi:MAG TPA: MFS transporter, partial [Labilithrix sp.]|nr:MFS transporter [Labilithrix sp.]
LTTARALSVARFFDGAFSVAGWVAAETSLLARSDKTNKALVMSLYALSLAFGYVLGPILALGIVKAAGTGASFFVAGIFACVASLVLFTGLDRSRTESGAHHIADGRARTPARAVLWRTKTSCLATFSYGYFQASVVLFLPLFLIETKHVPESRTILVTAFFAGGMVISSTFMGRLGDRYGHLLVMRLLATVGAAMVASFVVLSSFEAMCASVFVAGATLASISPVSLALQGVVVQERDLGRANAFYNATYAAGMLLGPPVSSLLFTKLGGDAMLLHLAAIWAVFVTFTMVFANDDPRRALLRASALGARPVHGECGHPERGERIAAREYPAGGEATVSLGRDIRP